MSERQVHADRSERERSPTTTPPPCQPNSLKLSLSQVVPLFPLCLCSLRLSVVSLSMCLFPGDPLFFPYCSSIMCPSSVLSIYPRQSEPYSIVPPSPCSSFVSRSFVRIKESGRGTQRNRYTWGKIERWIHSETCPRGTE